MSMLKSLLLVFVLLFGLLQYKLWFSANGMTHTLQLKHQISRQTQINARLSERNQTLAREIDALKSNKSAMESLARQKLGMIKDNETYYQFVAPSKLAKSDTSAT
ncbi:MAG: septum formation initiator family protein [Pseudomonadota bacterium]